jgi:predicted Zn-dependent protease
VRHDRHGHHGQAGIGPNSPRSDRGAAIGHYITSVYLERLGRIQEAFEELKQVPELDKTAVYPSLRLIRTYVRAQEFEKAKGLAENAVEQMPDNPALWIMLGEVYHQLKQYDDAITAFNKAIALSPDNVHGYGALAEVLETTNDLVSSLEIYEKLVKLNPDSAGLQFQLGATLVRMNDREAAVAAFQKTMELNAGFSQARYMLGTLYLELDRPEEAVRELKTYTEQRAGDARALEVLTGSLARLGRNEEALATLRAVLATESALPKHHVLASLLLLKAGKPAEAEQTAPPTAPIYGTLMRALARKAQGQPHQPLIESLDAAESDVDQESVEILNDLTYLLGKEGGATWLFDEFTALQEGLPTSRALTLARARILFSLERYQDAIPMLEGLLAAGPPDKTLLYYLSDANEKLKNVALAEKYLLAYLELDPDNPEMLNFLGYLYADQT